MFWNSFSKDLSIRREEVETEVLDFYGNDFNQAICTTRPDPFAAEIIRYLKEKGKKVYLATNPVFPRCATMNRIRWAGLTRRILRRSLLMRPVGTANPAWGISRRSWRGTTLSRSAA